MRGRVQYKGLFSIDSVGGDGGDGGGSGGGGGGNDDDDDERRPTMSASVGSRRQLSVGGGISGGRQQVSGGVCRTRFGPVRDTVAEGVRNHTDAKWRDHVVVLEALERVVRTCQRKRE